MRHLNFSSARGAVYGPKLVYSGLLSLCLTLGLSFLVGCQEDTEIYTQIVPADPPPGTPVKPVASNMPAAMPDASQASRSGTAATLAWQLPDGWKEAAGSPPRIATLYVGEGDNKLEFTVTRFPGDVGGFLANINRWRGQIGLDSLPQDREVLEKLIEEGKIIPVQEPLGLIMVNFRSETQGVLAAIIPDPQQANTWFIKAMGDKKLIDMHQPAFDSFMRSGLSFPGQSGTGASGPTGPTGPAPQTGPTTVPDDFAQQLPPEPLGDFQWQGPADFEALPASNFVTAGYTYKKDGKEAKLTLSKLPGRGGEMKANIDRWRRQIGLQPVSSQEAAQLLNNPDVLQVAGGMGILFSMENSSTNQKTSVVIVPRRFETWYIKLSGDLTLVNDKKSAIADFCNSIQKK